MIEDGKAPFAEMPAKQYLQEQESDSIESGDTELMEVIEEFDSEEE